MIVRLLPARARRSVWLFSGLVLGVLAGLSAAAASDDPLPTAAAGAVPDYAAANQPIFNRRCIACHGCLGSPCNVKLDSFAATKARLEPKGWSLDAIWDGDGDNENAWLTVLRHETNVSVLKGARGGMPHSLWLVSYAGFERMYYDTVAGFAYWEGDPEKLETLLFFNFLRQSFEDDILLLLPKRHRWW